MKLFCLLLLCLLLSCLLLHCQGDRPENLTPGEEELLVETTTLLSLAAQEYVIEPAQKHARDSEVLTARQDSIFSSQGLDREGYFRLVEKMNHTPERWVVVWERIAKRIEEFSGENP
jgi:hypothetical protein